SGAAPTLVPSSTSLCSPPPWVNRTIRLSAVVTQSTSSVPESIAIRAPADNANHSTGTFIRSAKSSAATILEHSGSDNAPSALVGSPSSTTLVIPSGKRSVTVVTTPTTTAAVFCPLTRSTGVSVCPSGARSYSTKPPCSPASMSASSYGYT